MYHPEFLSVSTKFENRKLSNLRTNKDKILEIANIVFDYKKSDLFDRKFILLDQPLNEYHKDIEHISIVDSIVDIIGIQNITIKMHHRSNIDMYKDRNYHLFTDTSIPWELHILNNIDYKNILISFSSSAMFTPMLCFDLTNPILCIPCLLKDTNGMPPLDSKGGRWVEDTLRLASFFSDTIICVENLDELKDMLNKLSN